MECMLYLPSCTDRLCTDACGHVLSCDSLQPVGFKLRPSLVRKDKEALHGSEAPEHEAELHGLRRTARSASRWRRWVSSCRSCFRGRS